MPALPSLVQFDMHRNQRRNSGADIDSAKPFRCSRRERCRARSRIRELSGIGFGFGFAGGVRIRGSEIWFTGNRRTGNRLRGPENRFMSKSQDAQGDFALDRPGHMDAAYDLRILHRLSSIFLLVYNRGEQWIFLDAAMCAKQ